MIEGDILLNAYTRTLINRLALVWCTGFGSGRIPQYIRLPGIGGATFGSAAAALIAAGAYALHPTFWIPLTLFALHVLLAAFWIERAEDLLGPRMDPHGHIRMHNQNEIVIDEWIAMFLISTGLAIITPVYEPHMLGFFFISLTLGFFVFRIIDILKPWPLRKLEQLPGWLGVIADDAIGGMAALAIVSGCSFFFLS